MKPEDLTGTPWQENLRPDRTEARELACIGREDQGSWPHVDGLVAGGSAGNHSAVLLIDGDADIVRPEHVLQMFRLLGGRMAGDLVGLPRAQLAVLPGTTHVTLVDLADWLFSMVTAFLDAPVPKAK